MYLSLYCKGSKRLFKVLWWEGAETEQNCNILTPTLMAVNVVSFLLSWCSTRGPGAQLSAGWWLSYCILSATSLDPNSSGPPPPGFLYHILSSNSSNIQLYSNCLTSVLTEWYNSSTPTRSPTQSLEWHVWSSSSGNNCHAVQRSLSSGASLWSGTFTLSHIISLRDFLS